MEAGTGKRKAASFQEAPFRYIIEKANPVFLICLAVFLVSFLVVLNVPLEDPPQSMFLHYLVIFFDVIGMISVFVAYLSVGISEKDYIK
jgi:hypothetical protein